MPYKISNRRYAGNKSKLSDWIFDLIEKECSGNIFADIFAGTGSISSVAVKKYEEVIINDFLYSNYIIFKGFFGKGKWNNKKLQKFVDKYNSLLIKDLKNNYFSKHFGEKYFSKSVSKKIGYLREDLELNKNNLTKKEYFILLSSLLYSIDKIANTVGHYDAYLGSKPKEENFEFKLIEPIKSKKVKIFRKDTNELVKKIYADIVYVDPPYNSRQYSRLYHVLENLIKWDFPKLFGVALKPEPDNVSEYCKVGAKKAFEDLIKNLNCKYIVVSYNNTYDSKSSSSKNKITLKDIKNILDKRGNTKIFKKNYRFFNSGKTNFKNHQEIVFITKVK